VPPKPRPSVTLIIPRLGGVPGRIQQVLERKGQVILYGPPGTGKSYWAEAAARDLAAYSGFGRSFSALAPDQQRHVVGGEGVAGGTVRLCCFHPAYGYEDFLEGYRPEAAGGQMTFPLRDGVFKKLCADAVSRPAERFYLIIDEINRGDIPRIFGELLTVLEKSKRGKPILLPLTGSPFLVPKNVYLIGTMNTADRSIALLDTALRRRFGFIELMPDISLLDPVVVGGIPLGPWLDALNDRICEHIGRDARNLRIGHSYLMEQDQPVCDFGRFAEILREDVIPLLEEYCYEDYSTLKKILGESLVDENRQTIRHELFSPQCRQELLQALLAPCSQIAACAQVVAAEATAIEEEENAPEEEE
jgi:5-methylcytosine-specific restriction enzyme B